MNFNCFGKECKYFKDDCVDGPGYCGLISSINEIFKVVKLPKCTRILWSHNHFVECPFDSFEICRANNLDWNVVYDLNKAANEEYVISPDCFVETINLLKKGGSKE